MPRAHGTHGVTRERVRTDPCATPLKPTQFAILSYNYGSVRKPVVFYWLFSLMFFGLSLLGLHWWEKDERPASGPRATHAGAEQVGRRPRCSSP